MTFVEFAALYVAGAAVAALICGALDATDYHVLPLVVCWPLVAVGGALAAPFVLFYRASLALRAWIDRCNGSGPL